MDSYFSRTEVSNSDLTELKNILYPKIQYGDKEKAFKFGTLFDAVITEPYRVNYFRRTVDSVEYTKEDFDMVREMHKSLKKEAEKDPFLAFVLSFARTQEVTIVKSQQFFYDDFPFYLDTRCKWDWFFPQFRYGGDLKSTFASTQDEFSQAIDFFDWDRSRAWYMDMVKSEQDFIYAVSKKNFKVFKHFIKRGDETYNRGKEKYTDLAFKYWSLIDENILQSNR